MDHYVFQHDDNIFPIEAAPCKNLWYFKLLTLNVDISRLDDIGCKYLTSGFVCLKKAHL